MLVPYISLPDTAPAPPAARSVIGAAIAALKLTEEAAQLAQARKAAGAAALKLVEQRLAGATALMRNAEEIVKQADAETDAVKKAMMGPARRQAMKNKNPCLVELANKAHQVAQDEVQMLSEEATQVEEARQAAWAKLLELSAAPPVVIHGEPYPSATLSWLRKQISEEEWEEIKAMLKKRASKIDGDLNSAEQESPKLATPNAEEEDEWFRPGNYKSKTKSAHAKKGGRGLGRI